MDEQFGSKPAIQAQSIVNMLTEPVLILDDSLVAVVANPAFYDTVEISPGELEGTSFKELADSEKGQQTLQAISEIVVALDREEQRVNLDCVVPPDTYRTLSVTSRRIRQSEEPGEWILVELRDITAERESERRLKELNDALVRRGAELERINEDLESFNRWVSHDLRTPLRFTSTIAHRLLERDDPALPPPVLDSIRMILECTEEMGKLIEKLLAFSQLDRVPLKRRRTDIARLARQALADLEVKDEANQRMQVIIDKLPPCYADAALMKQVLLNLLSNAITSTSSCEQPEIRVGFEQDADGATVYFVRDNGVGFNMNEAEKLFRPFYRLRRVPTPHGTGVGLTLVQRVIERHEGRIWAEGEPGHGATIYFQLREKTKPANSLPGKAEGEA